MDWVVCGNSLEVSVTKFGIDWIKGFVVDRAGINNNQGLIHSYILLKVLHRSNGKLRCSIDVS